MVGGKFIYHWLPATGEFEYIPSEDDGNNEEDREQSLRRNAEKFSNERKVVF